MRIILSLCLLLVGGTAALAGHSLEHDDGLIVAGERIGPARLGMSAAEIDALNAVVPCPTAAAYDSEGRAVRLATEWGGACRVSGDVQVGAGFPPVLRMFGSPGAVVEDARYSRATAYWVSYPGWGIAFRVLVHSDSSTLIQSIAVFPGTATGRLRTRVFR